jgi:hypothetical protein
MSLNFDYLWLFTHNLTKIDNIQIDFAILNYNFDKKWIVVGESKKKGTK